LTPRPWVFAGPNGAGKSTIVDHYVDVPIPIINPDNIARTLPPELGDTARRLQSGKRAVEDRMTLLASRRSFGIETTLTGNSELALVRSALEAGYQVNLVYVGIRDVSHSIGRVRERVSRGGHDVLIDDISRGFDRSLTNLAIAVQARAAPP
jgi:predicted ABC-type ATPase